jgi:peptidoglycan/xylan/chitin deacetylase (PgdA/CDA1 family)/membrane-associated phospholipid phosphatase
MNPETWLTALSRADAAAFAWINGTLYWRPLADLTFALARDLLLLGLLLAAVGGYALWRGLPRAAALGLWGALAVLLSNLVHNEWLKPFFHRTRPFLVQPDVHLSAGLRDLSAVSLSFPSTHSASAAALAVVVAGLEPRLRWPAAIFALGVGCGAIYSGGHYPLDVAAGYAVGLCLGLGVRALQRRTWPRTPTLALLLAVAALAVAVGPARADTGTAQAALAPVPVLCYHRFGAYPETDPYFVTIEEFRRQLTIVRDEGFTPILAGELADGLDGKRALPAKPLLITIDDGYRDAFTQALPVLESFGYRATLFVYPGYTGSRLALSVEQVQALQAKGWEIGSHSYTHPKLTQPPRGEDAAARAQRLDHELAGSRRQLQEWLKAPVESLAYPYGLWDREIAEAAHAAGYRVMFTVDQGTNDAGTPHDALKRIMVLHGTRDSTFKYLLDDRPLPLTERTPAFGEPASAPLERVTAVVAPALRARLLPASVKALWGGAHLAVTYDPATGALTLTLPGPWRKGMNGMMLVARDAEGRHYKESWLVGVRPAGTSQGLPQEGASGQPVAK